MTEKQFANKNAQLSILFIKNEALPAISTDASGSGRPMTNRQKFVDIYYMCPI